MLSGSCGEDLKTIARAAKTAGVYHGLKKSSFEWLISAVFIDLSDKGEPITEKTATKSCNRVLKRNTNNLIHERICDRTHSLIY
jgi:hypothetical protein